MLYIIVAVLALLILHYALEGNWGRALIFVLIFIIGAVITPRISILVNGSGTTESGPEITNGTSTGSGTNTTDGTSNESGSKTTDETPTETGNGSATVDYVPHLRYLYSDL